jgi:hypothetical protein
MTPSSAYLWLTSQVSVKEVAAASSERIQPRFKYETQRSYMKQNVKAEEIVAEACASVMIKNGLPWSEVRKAIKAKIAELPEEDRMSVENELRLMLSRDEDQTHNVVVH